MSDNVLYNVSTSMRLYSHGGESRLKGLTYLYEFEKLLESANNPLVQQACAEGCIHGQA